VRVIVLAAALLAATAALAQPSPERNAATQADYRATLGRLGIESIRPGADGFNRSAPNAANYDEARVGPVPPLPALLVAGNGRPVANSRAWRSRRAEIMRLADSQMYGRVPASAPAIHWLLTAVERREIGGVAVVTHRYIGNAARSGLDSPPLAINLTLNIPEAHRAVSPSSSNSVSQRTSGFRDRRGRRCRVRPDASRCFNAAGASPCWCRTRSSPTTAPASTKG